MNNPVNKLFVKVAFSVTLLLTALTSNAGELPDFTKLIEKASPSVVKIDVEVVREAPEANIPDDAPEILKRFFEQQRPQGPRRGQSMGSGFVISKDGYILTNNHVVQDADSIVVHMSDRRDFDAKVIGTDPRSDLALLKIDAKNLKPVEFADSEKSKVGEWVVAIGSPFGLDYSASAGIISAKGRSLPSENGDNYVPFIQTDVAINPGNSGGPLFTLDGKVVGINSQIYTRSGGYMGLSFAIPSNVAKNVIAQLKENGSVKRGWLGVAISDVSRDLAEAMGLDRSRGALVNAVVDDGPAQKAGLKAGDVILSFDGKNIEESGDLPHVVGLMEAGDKAKVVVMREMKKKTITVTLGDLPEHPSLAAKTDKAAAADAGRLGLAVTGLDKGEAKSLDIEGGVRVTEVTKDSAADKAGLVKGDVINTLNFKVMSSVDEFQAMEKELPKGKKVPIRFLREGYPVFRTIMATK